MHSVMWFSVVVPAFNFLFFIIFCSSHCYCAVCFPCGTGSVAHFFTGRAEGGKQCALLAQLFFCGVAEFIVSRGVVVAWGFPYVSSILFCGLFGCLHGGVDKHLTWTSTVAGLHSLPASIRGVFLKVDSKELFLAAFHQSSSHYIFVSLLVSGRSRWEPELEDDIDVGFVVLFQFFILAWFSLCLTTWSGLLRFDVLLWMIFFFSCPARWFSLNSVWLVRCWFPCVGMVFSRCVWSCSFG